MKKLLYLLNLRLPTEKAYGIQIAKMCEAFALLKVKSKNEKVKTENIDVELIVPYRRNPIKKDVFEYYSVKKIFKIKKLPAIDLYLPGPLDKIAVGVKSFISAVILVFYTFFLRADIIYSRDELILFLLSFFRRNIIFEAHRFSTKRSFFYLRFKKKRIKIIAISQAIKNDLINAGYEPNKILVAPDGVDLDLFKIDVSKEETRKRLNLPLDSKIVMYAGHLFEWKGVTNLLQAAKLATDRRILFVFVGGAEYDLRQFREKAQGLDNVLILGHRPYKEMPLFLKAADLLVLPNSAKEEILNKYTSPLKLFEYMASERPIIASDLLSLREILNDKNSILISSDNPSVLFDAIIKLLNDKELGDKVALMAFDDVKKYTWQKRAEKITNFVN